MFSIVTVCFNSARTIQNTVESIRSQTDQDYEHIIIDGGSSDETLQILKNWSHDPRVIIVSEKDNGIYDAMNKAVSLAKGKFISFLNSDDIFAHKDDLASLKCFIEKNSSASFIYSNAEFIAPDGTVSRVWSPSSKQKYGIFTEQFPHPSVFIKTEIMKSLSPAFDISYQISADLKQQLFIANKLKIKPYHFARTTSRISIGGRSTQNLYSYFEGWVEARRAFNEVFGRGGLLFVLLKVTSKLAGLIRFKLKTKLLRK